jgi:hypothetical protein
MTRQTTLVLTVGLAAIVLWLLAGYRVADHLHRAQDPVGWPRASSAGNGSGQHTEITNAKGANPAHFLPFAFFL